MVFLVFSGAETVLVKLIKPVPHGAMRLITSTQLAPTAESWDAGVERLVRNHGSSLMFWSPNNDLEDRAFSLSASPWPCVQGRGHRLLAP